jgi:hypothetical protein
VFALFGPAAFTMPGIIQLLPYAPYPNGFRDFLFVMV